MSVREFSLSPARRRTVARLASEFVTERVEGKPHRRATEREAPPTPEARKQMAIEDRRAFRQRMAT